MTVMLMIGDCRRSLAKLRDQSVHTCVTSPPYFGLVAQRNGRNSVLCELNYDYASIMTERLGDVFGWFPEVVR